MSISVNNTPLLPQCYNHWALCNNRQPMHNCLRQADGTLWALVPQGIAFCHLLKSTDNGFSWSVIRDDIGGNVIWNNDNTVDGPSVGLYINETWNVLDAYTLLYNSVSGDHDLRRSRFDLDNVADDTPTTEELSAGFYGAGFTIVGSQDQSFIIATVAATGVTLYRASPRTTSISAGTDVETAGPFGHQNAVVDKDNNVDIIYSRGVGSTVTVEHRRFTSLGGMSSRTVIATVTTGGTSQPFDLDIKRDGLGTLCAVWGEWNLSNDTEVHYATSIDDGATWDENTLTRTAGHGAFTDAVTGDEMTRTSVIGAAGGGFMITYVEDNASAVAKTYVRQLTTSDSGATYDLQEELEIGTSQPAASLITGARFFHPTTTKLLDFSDPGLVRIGYQVGEGTDSVGDDDVAILIAQEPLSESAYPLTLPSDTGSYTIETGDESSIVVSVDIIGSMKDHVDFYDAGLTGAQTDKYIAAFTKLGTTVRLLKYEPDTSNDMSDKSAYGAATETWTRIMLDPQSYSFPVAVQDPSNTSGYVEQDIRKVYFSPDFFLSRTFLVNSGGFLKRTVWLLEHDGNQYEISQVVPRFVSNQICYYEANLYVVGPSRDPFSRVILPSEN